MKVSPLQVFALGLLALHAPSQAAEHIYRFVDRNGVIHLTNVPTDARYRLYYQGAKQALGSPAHLRESDSNAGFVPEPDVHTEEDLLAGQDAGIPGAVEVPDAPHADKR